MNIIIMTSHDVTLALNEVRVLLPSKHTLEVKPTARGLYIGG